MGVPKPRPIPVVERPRTRQSCASGLGQPLWDRPRTLSGHRFSVGLLLPNSEIWQARRTEALDCEVYT